MISDRGRCAHRISRGRNNKGGRVGVVVVNDLIK